MIPTRDRPLKMSALGSFKKTDQFGDGTSWVWRGKPWVMLNGWLEVCLVYYQREWFSISQIVVWIVKCFEFLL